MKNIRSVLVESAVTINRNPPENLTNTDVELFEDAYRYETNDVYLKSFSNVWVSPNSVVYKYGNLLRETVASDNQISYYRLRFLAKKLLTGKRVRLSEVKNYLLATDQESSGHFHWFTEVLPRLWVIKERLPEFVLLLRDTPYMRKTALESIELLNLSFDDVLFMQEANLYTVRNFHYVSRIAKSGQMHDTLMKKINTAFVGDKEGGANRIYFSRENALFRKVLNETELTAKLKDHGFETIYGESNSLREQIEVFAKCSTLIGIHGAGLTNSIFMKPGSTMIELRKREKNYGYWHLADSLDHKYYYYNGLPDSDASLIGRGCNLTIPAKDFENGILTKI